MRLVIKAIAESLKDYLRANESQFHHIHEMCGDTETGFWDEHEFDMEALMVEIDRFVEELAAKRIGGGP